MNKQNITQIYADQLISPQSLSEMPRDTYMVYILTYNETPIVVGHGKYNRAKVIFDTLDKTTTSHIKSFVVRCYHLFGDGDFKRYFIECDSKKDASAIEQELHTSIGGNDRTLPGSIQDALYDGIAPDTVSETLLRIAQSSSFSGISDLKRWHKHGIVNEKILNPIFLKLRL